MNKLGLALPQLAEQLLLSSMKTFYLNDLMLNGYRWYGHAQFLYFCFGNERDVRAASDGLKYGAGRGMIHHPD